jgi:hypothetical protein
MERYRAGFLAFVALLLLGVLTITFVIWAALCSVHANEVGKCWPYDDALKVVVERGLVSHSMLMPVPPQMMPSFLVSLGDKGKGVKGDAAVAMITRSHQFALFVKRGEALCLAIYDNGHNPPDVDL